jgi:hypothetical protein
VSDIIGLIKRNSVVHIKILLNTVKLFENCWVNTRLVFLHTMLGLADETNVLCTVNTLLA